MFVIVHIKERVIKMADSKLHTMFLPTILHRAYSRKYPFTIREGRKNFTSVFAQSKVDRYPKEVIDTLQKFGDSFKESLTRYILTVRSEKQEPYYDVLANELCPELMVSKNALMVWGNFWNNNGKKFGIGDLVQYMYKTGDFEPMEVLYYYCKQLKKKRENEYSKVS